MTEDAWQRQHELFERDVRCWTAVPVIAAVNGHAYGGGFETRWPATSSMPRARALRAHRGALGIMPGGGGTQNLPRAVGERRAKEMILTGKPFCAEEALAWGHGQPGLRARADGGALETAQRSATTRRCRCARPRSPSTTAGRWICAPAALRDRGLQPPGRHRGPQEGVRAFNEKRKPVFKGTLARNEIMTMPRVREVGLRDGLQIIPTFVPTDQSSPGSRPRPLPACARSR